ncbi:MAG: hypothetical protein BGO98_18070 [Myxococcales bacterium 68-20]|nr:MAG: hypothetical protein BGO98_18070 [Myxococcales bacterium 68-20]
MGDRQRARPWRLGVLGGALAIVAACAESKNVLVVAGDDPGVDGGAQTFAPSPSVDGGDAAVVAPPELPLCIGTECPAPWATCPSEDRATYACGTDLSRDPDNCGACGNKCLEYRPTHMTSRCVDGACELECMSPPFSLEGDFDWRNCNGLVDDGCEVDLLSDPKNCGACGNACAPGVFCSGGQCGCPSGLVDCGGSCVDPMNDDNNCGGCNNRCAPPADACRPMPPRAYYGCRAGACGALKCQVPSADCNNDLDQCGGDGCELDRLGTRDNCGGCGIKCAPGLDCIDEGNGPECGVPCVKAGKVLCGVECTDLLNNPNHCGGCGAACRAAGPNQARLCTKGICTYECMPGFADCNDDPTDGCETNLSIHPAHCGACGNACDLAAGQPCVEGQCLMVACDGGVTAK